MKQDLPNVSTAMLNMMGPGQRKTRDDLYRAALAYAQGREDFRANSLNNPSTAYEQDVENEYDDANDDFEENYADGGEEAGTGYHFAGGDKTYDILEAPVPPVSTANFYAEKKTACAQGHTLQYTGTGRRYRCCDCGLTEDI